MSQPIRGQTAILFWIPFSGFRGEVENVSANQMLGQPSCFQIAPENTHLVDDIEILLPAKFCWILFSGFRGEVENVLANQRIGRPSFFWIGLKNTNFVEDVEILLPVKFYWILLSGFRREVENDSANQRMGGHLCLSDWPPKHKLGRGCWDLASCHVSFNSVQWFQRRSLKWEKLMTDGQQTDGRTTDNAWSQ